jgi:peptidoglycan/xylan/chitin deacetylase (PgdA/CDA1 family)
LSTAKTTPALPTLTFLYHELRKQKSKYSYVLDCKEFEEQVALFAECRQAAPRFLQPEISFDDGHRSDYEYALPVLVARGMVAHFFITVGWTGRKSSYMGWREVRALHAVGQRVGAHGWTHTLLTRCSAPELEKELGGARQTLEDKLGCSITSMSLPGGRYNRRVLAACQAAGYRQVFTSIPRAEAAPPGLLIGRLNILSGMSLPALRQLLLPESTALAKLHRRYHLKEAAKLLLGDRLYARLWTLVSGQEPDAGLITVP